MQFLQGVKLFHSSGLLVTLFPPPGMPSYFTPSSLGPPPPLPHLSSSCSVPTFSLKPFFPLPPSPSLQHILLEPTQPSRSPTASWAWLRQHLPCSFAMACSFPFLSGAGPVTQILFDSYSQPPNLGDIEESHQDFSCIILKIPRTLRRGM